MFAHLFTAEASNPIYTDNQISDCNFLSYDLLSTATCTYQVQWRHVNINHTMMGFKLCAFPTKKTNILPQK